MNRSPPIDAGAAQPERNRAAKRLREKVVAEEQAKLRELRELLDSKKLQIERYVRVASPARGTTLLSDNLDVFLSGCSRSPAAWSAQ